MKCPNCSAEWHLPEQIHTNLSACPFCGASLQCGSSKSFSTMDDVLYEIIQRFGTDILRDGRKIVAVFSDLAPQLRRERLLLNYLVQFDGNLKLLEVKNQEKAIQRTSYLKVVQYLSEEQLVARDAAESVCLSFLKAIDVTIENPVSERATIGASPVVKKPFLIPAKQSTKSTSPKTSIQKEQPKIKDYQQYMKALEIYFLQNGKTKLSYQQILSFVSENELDKDWKITCTDVEKDLSKVYAKYSAVLPSAIQPTKRPSTKTSIQKAQPKIRDYQQYMKALEDYFLQNGKTKLSYQQILSFVSVNELDKDWKITCADVEKDLSKVYAKYFAAPPSAKKAVAPSHNVGRSIHTYKAYMDELEQMYIRNGKTTLSSAQIVDFLSKHALDRWFGIGISDVESDLATIADKYKK